MVLARPLESEAFLKTTSSQEAVAKPRCDLQCQKVKVERKPTSRKLSPGGFCGSWWGCSEKGHRVSVCPRVQRTHSFDWLDSVYNEILEIVDSSYTKTTDDIIDAVVNCCKEAVEEESDKIWLH